MQLVSLNLQKDKKDQIMGLKREKAENIIQRHILYSMGAGAIPIPLIDLGAVTAVQLLPTGVHIVINGRVFDPNRVQKNLELNRFEEAGHEIL